MILGFFVCLFFFLAVERLQSVRCLLLWQDTSVSQWTVTSTWRHLTSWEACVPWGTLVRYWSNLSLYAKKVTQCQITLKILFKTNNRTNFPNTLKKKVKIMLTFQSWYMDDWKCSFTVMLNCVAVEITPILNKSGATRTCSHLRQKYIH